MTVFIAHAEADREAVDQLAAFLKMRGHLVETETGERGFRFLQKMDVVVALWSKDATFSPWRLVMDKRMLDAWAEGQLVLVKLDHHFLPVGVRDLPAIDASFDRQRELVNWPQVDRAVREVRDRSFAPAPVSPEPDLDRAAPPGTDYGMVSGGAPVPAPSPQAPAPSAPAQRPAASAKRAAKAAPAVFGHLFAIVAVAVAAAALIYFRVPYAVPITVVAAALTFLVPLWLFLRPRPRAGATEQAAQQRKRQKDDIFISHKRDATGVSKDVREAAERHGVWTDAESVAEAPARFVFISYAHADNAEVTPVVQIVRDNGREVWMDTGVHGAGIQAGQSWAGEIVRAIKSANGVIVMCSKKAFESDHVKREVYLADRHKKPMLPVFIEEAAPPEDFEYFFASVQWLELFKLPESDRPGAVAKALAGV